MADHPITPPPELMGKWEEDWHHSKVKHIELEDYIAAQAAQWGADQELEACCEWLEHKVLLQHQHDVVPALRAARRPKPPSFKRVALLQLDTLNADLGLEGKGIDLSQIRRALEQLDD